MIRWISGIEYEGGLKNVLYAINYLRNKVRLLFLAAGLVLSSIISGQLLTIFYIYAGKMAMLQRGTQSVPASLKTEKDGKQKKDLQQLSHKPLNILGSGDRI